MNIYEQISEALHKEWKEGATQQEIADRAGVTNQHINNLLSGKRKIESMKLETLLKLFPKVKIDLTGAQFAGNNSVQVQGGNYGNINSLSLDAMLDKILADDTLSDAEKIKVIKVLKK